MAEMKLHYALLICAWSLSNIKMYLGQTWLSLRNKYLILRSKYFYFPHIGTYILKIHLSTWNLDYMIPKGISHTLVQNPTYKFQNRNLRSIHENISSIQNYQGLSLLPVTFTAWFGRFVPSTGSWHGQLCGDIMYLALIVQWQNTCQWCRGPEFKS